MQRSGMQRSGTQIVQPQPPVPLTDEALLDGREAGRMTGGKHRTTRWRWQRDERVRFPPPDEVINGRDYWGYGTLRRWLGRQAAQNQRKAAE